METGALQNAIKAFDGAIERYPQFSDGYFYKGKCLGLSGRVAEGLQVMRTGKAFYGKGYSINEDNSFYEPYPYQVSWRWKAMR